MIYISFLLGAVMVAFSSSIMLAIFNRAEKHSRDILSYLATRKVNVACFIVCAFLVGISELIWLSAILLRFHTLNAVLLAIGITAAGRFLRKLINFEGKGAYLWLISGLVCAIGVTAVVIGFINTVKLPPLN